MTDTPLYVRHINPTYAPLMLLAHPTAHARHLLVLLTLGPPLLLAASHRTPQHYHGAFFKSPRTLKGDSNVIQSFFSSLRVLFSSSCPVFSGPHVPTPE